MTLNYAKMTLRAVTACPSSSLYLVVHRPSKPCKWPDCPHRLHTLLLWTYVIDSCRRPRQRRFSAQFQSNFTRRRSNARHMLFRVFNASASAGCRPPGGEWRMACRPVGGLSGVHGRPKHFYTQTEPYLQTLTTLPMPTLIQCRGVARYTLELPGDGEVKPPSSLERLIQLW